MNQNVLRKIFSFKSLMWVIYLGLLIVITPHTQWMFAQLEPEPTTTGGSLAWVAAVVFEALIFISTHLFVQHISKRKPSSFNFERARVEQWHVGKLSYGSLFTWWPSFKYRWLNAYAAFVFVAITISGVANLTHAVQFGEPPNIVAKWGISFDVFALIFGGALPFVNLLFAAVLAQMEDAEEAPNPELDKAKSTIVELRRQVKETEAQKIATEESLKQSEVARRDAEVRFGAAGDLFARLFSDDKRQRILAIHEKWPELPQKSIVIMAKTSESHVSEVLKGS